MYGLLAGTKYSDRCREVTVSGGSTVWTKPSTIVKIAGLF